MWLRTALHPVIFAICLCLSSAVLGDEYYGQFKGLVNAEWQGDGRSMKLTAPFAYVDPTGVEWNAPVGSIVDGASIPGFAWSFIGGPFEGGYRNASVVHDVACVTKKRPWEFTHLAFYYAMRAAGVSETQAYVMYAAVYHFGPRWPSKEIIRADEENDAARKVLKDRAPGTKLTLRKAKRVVDPLFPKKKQWDYEVTLEPPEPLSDPQDFEKVKDQIYAQKGKMTLKDIRAWRPTP